MMSGVGNRRLSSGQGVVNGFTQPLDQPLRQGASGRDRDLLPQNGTDGELETIDGARARAGRPRRENGRAKRR